MKKVVFGQNKKYSNKEDLRAKKCFITNPKKILRKHSGEKYKNNTAIFYYKNPYLNNSINIFDHKENSKNDIPKERIISPSKLFTKVNSYQSKTSKLRPQSSSIRQLPSLNNSNAYPSFSPNNYLNLETEKLSQEKYQLNKLIRKLKQELIYLKKENEEKDELLSIKEKEINEIISNSNNILGEDLNKSMADNKTMHTEDNIIQTNSAFNLYLKIKKEISSFNNQTNEQEKLINNLKHSIYYTKMHENKIANTLLEDQINKINNLMENAFVIRESNSQQIKEYNNMNYKITVQNNIINELTKKMKCLTEDKDSLENEIKNIKWNITYNKDKMFKNKKEINSLKKKNNSLCNDQVVKSQVYVSKNNNNVSINSLYLKKISELKKIVNFYKGQNKYNESILEKLKGQKKSLLDSLKLSDNNKLPASFLSLKKNSNEREKINNNNIKITENLGFSKSKEEEKINQFRTRYKTVKEEEKKMELQYKECQDKLKQINEYIQQQQNIANNENNDLSDEEKGHNQIEFGIDENNPYYTDNEENQPDIQNKFTTSQFNQFTYILFKNFEAKGVVGEESKNKILNPFIKYAEDNKINILQYPSEQFDLLSEEYTKIILNSINSENSYNHLLTRIFISALLFNSGCLVQKLIDYFNILFSYTRNYLNEEEKYKKKLRKKYMEQLKNLINCINNYLENDKKIKKYEDTPIYFPLIKIKELIEVNNINLKDKYVEFLFYYMKKYNDNEAKLEELKYDLLNEIIDEQSNNKSEKDEKKEDKEEKENDNNDNNNYEDKSNNDKNNLVNLDNLGEKIDEYKNIIIDKKKDDNNDNINVEEDFDKNDKIEMNPDKIKENSTDKNILNNENDNFNDIENFNENDNINENINDNIIDNINGNINDNIIDNNKDLEDKKNLINTEKKSASNSAVADESMTEITNEEYLKQLSDCIKIIKNGLKSLKITFREFIRDIRQEIAIENLVIECITIDDFNEILKRIGIVFSDLKLSCLCSKYSLPNELRLIEVKKLEEDINE